MFYFFLDVAPSLLRIASCNANANHHLFPHLGPLYNSLNGFGSRSLPTTSLISSLLSGTSS